MCQHLDVTLHWTLGDVVAKLRSAKGLGAYELADLAGVKPNTISTLESGGNSQQKTLEKVAGALETTVAEMLAMIPQPKRAQNSAPEQPSSDEPTVTLPFSQAQSLPTSAVRGKTSAVPSGDELGAVLDAMRQATAALTLALQQTSAIAGKQMVDRSRQAAKARAARTRKRAKHGKDRRRGSGAA